MTQLSIRQLAVNPEQEFSRYWHGGDAFRSLLLNSLSMMFPAGEQFFVDSVREFQDVYKDKPALRAAAEGFIGQEATHRHMHHRFNEQLYRQGHRNLVDRWIRKRIFLSHWFDRRSRLSITIAYEHFTAVLGDIALRHDVILAGADPEMALLWRWHSAEESEHKSVAYDVYVAAGGGYWRRVLGFLFVSARFGLDLLLQTAYCLHQDRKLLRWKTWASAARFSFGPRGVIWKVLPHWLAYLLPGFHPAQHDSEGLVAAWLRDNETRYRVVARR